MHLITQLINATVFSLMGVAVFGISFLIADKLTPVQLWKGIVDEKNIALAIVTGAMAISIGMIVAAAVQG